MGKGLLNGAVNRDRDEHIARSEYIRSLVQCPFDTSLKSNSPSNAVPKNIIQYWHDMECLPRDVAQCVETWKDLSKLGFEHKFFDSDSARKFILNGLGERYARAFDRCYHPAMQSDYFRLCYFAHEGGIYIDADDEFLDGDIDMLCKDGRLKLQPLCYEISSSCMVETERFLQPDAYASDWIFYFNNNPIIACAGDFILTHALDQATLKLEKQCLTDLPEIQSTTGPGNLSKAIFELGSSGEEVRNRILVLDNWNAIALSKWPLSYRDDARNWRLSNQIRFLK